MAKQPIDAGLSRRERQIMNALFALEEAAATEVVDHLGEPDAYDSVRVTLGNLEKKGYVKHRREGVRHIYFPAITRQKAQRSAIGHLTRTFFGGSPSRAILAFLDASADRLSDEELEEIARRIEERKKDS